MKMKMKMRKGHWFSKWVVLVVSALMFSVVAVSPLLAEEEKPQAEASVSVLSDYVWRGQELGRDSIVIQPSVTISYKGLAANVWSNVDTDPYVTEGGQPANWNETDFTFSYERGFGPVTATAGYIYYGLDAVDDSQEVFLGVSLDKLLSPCLTVYKEMDSYLYWYALLAISHELKITDKIALNLAASVSYLKSDDADEYPEVDDQGAATGEEFSDFHDGAISASLPVAVTQYLTVTPILAYTFPLSDDAKNEMKFRSRTGQDSNFLHGGVTMSMAF